MSITSPLPQFAQNGTGDLLQLCLTTAGQICSYLYTHSCVQSQRDSDLPHLKYAISAWNVGLSLEIWVSLGWATPSSRYVSESSASRPTLRLASPSRPLPLMIPNPRLPARLAYSNSRTTNPFHHPSRIINGHPTTPFSRAPSPSLHHTLPEQPPPIACSYPQFFASRSHGIILSLQLQLTSLLLFASKQLPRAMDGPMSEKAVSGEAERSRHEGCGMVKMVADHG